MQANILSVTDEERRLLCCLLTERKYLMLENAQQAKDLVEKLGFEAEVKPAGTKDEAMWKVVCA